MKYHWLLNDMPIDITMDSKVVIVGNSGNLIGSGKGEWIDSHDVIIRMSNSSVKGYERDVGSRETLRFLCYPAEPDKTTVYEETLREKHICLFSGNLLRLLSAITKMINFNHLYIMDLQFLSDNLNWFNHERSGYYQSDQSPKPPDNSVDKTKMPSLGLHTIIALTQSCKPNVIGFDFFQSDKKDYHYFQEFNGMDPNIHHDWHMEKLLIQSFDKKGIIQFHSL